MEDVQTLTFRTSRMQELLDITAPVRDIVSRWSVPTVVVYVPHTTAGVLINEHADPDVARDILAALDRIVPDDGLYRHAEGNSAAHVKATLVGTSQTVLSREGRLLLGSWQGIFLAEFDGPRTRTVLVAPSGAG
jgi:secondary thiamine-phosphate synthase enzyme